MRYAGEKIDHGYFVTECERLYMYTGDVFNTERTPMIIRVYSLPFPTEKPVER